MSPIALIKREGKVEYTSSLETGVPRVESKTRWENKCACLSIHTYVSLMKSPCKLT